MGKLEVREEGWFHSSHCSTMMRMAIWSAQGLLLWKMPAGLGAFCLQKKTFLQLWKLGVDCLFLCLQRKLSCRSGRLESTASFFVFKEKLPAGLALEVDCLFLCLQDKSVDDFGWHRQGHNYSIVAAAPQSRLVEEIFLSGIE